MGDEASHPMKCGLSFLLTVEVPPEKARLPDPAMSIMVACNGGLTKAGLRASPCHGHPWASLGNEKQCFTVMDCEETRPDWVS